MSLLDPVLSLLDRQVDALVSQSTTAEFLVSVEPFLRAIEAEPRIAVHLEDLRDETLDRVRVLENQDGELIPKLIALRTRLVELRPELDDGDAGPPSEGDDRDWIDSLAQFDVIAAAEPEPLNYKAEGARAQRLLEILRAKRDLLPRPHAGEVEAWVVDLHNLSEVWAHATRWLSLSMRVSAGLELLRLERVPPTLNPKPVIRAVGEQRTARFNAVFQRQFSIEGVFFNAVSDIRVTMFTLLTASSTNSASSNGVKGSSYVARTRGPRARCSHRRRAPRFAPTLWAADAAPRTTLTSVPVRAISIGSACQSRSPAPGSVAPR